MSDPIEVVEEYTRRWAISMDAFCDAVEEFFTPETEWENVGYATTIGAKQAIEHLRDAEARLGFDKVLTETIAIAAQGKYVLTERVDYHHAPDGTLLFTIRATSVFEVVDGKITALREYFDTAHLLTHRQEAGISEAPPGA